MDRTLDVLNNELDNLISEKHILNTIKKLKRSKENKNEWRKSKKLFIYNTG